MKKIVVLSFLLVFLATGCSIPGVKAKKVLTIEEAKAKVADFINNNLMQPGTKITVKEAVEEDGLYKVVVAMESGQEIDSYITKDGEKFFPQVMKISEIEAEAGNKAAEGDATEAQATNDVPKKEKAEVELFVMSHCPYGTQIEKGILPVLEALGDKVDFKLKFCDYAMHGEKEVNEELNQYCIQKNEPKKLLTYLKCFLGNGETEKCIQEANIETAKLKDCIAATDKEYKVTEKLNDKASWSNGNFPPFDVYKDDNAKYAVKGSPSLVINGKQVSSGRDAASLLKMVCAGYDQAPEECSKTVSSENPAPGFGFEAGGSAAGADAGCAN